jgi:HAE1 family hydrophobic/amphiphilic exporter-1
MLSNLFDKITGLSLRFRWITIGIAMIIMAAGIYSMTQLNQELLPRVEFPQTVVIIQWPESESADQFLEEVTIPLEEKLQSVDGVLNVESTTNPTFAFLIARYDFGLNQERVLEDINGAIESAGLPDTAEPQVLNFSFSDLPVVIASVSSSELTLAELKALVESDLKPSLEGLAPVSRVAVTGGQELPDETAVEPVAEAAAEAAAEAEEEPAPTATPEDPGRLPQIIIDGAADMGIEITHAQEITVDLLRSISDRPTADQDVMTLLAVFPTDLLAYVPAETLSYLPSEYMATLDRALIAELDELAADFGGVGQYTLAEATAALSGNEVAEEATTEPTETEVVTEAVTETAVLPTFAPVDLPETWIAGAAQMGQAITTTADITPEIMQAIASLAPEQLAELTPEMWRALLPEVTAVALPLVEADLDPLLVQQLQAIQAAANGEAPPSVELPQSWQEFTAGRGMPITSTAAFANLPPQAFAAMSGNNVPPELLADLTPEVLLGMPAELLAFLPPELSANLDEGMIQTFTNISIAANRHELMLAAETEEPAEEGEAAAAETETQPTPDPAAEAEEAAAASAEAPALTGIWAEPAPDGSAPLFTTAFDLINNGFSLSAAELLNFIPGSPNGEQAPQLIADLSPEVIAYLAENEEGFLQNLDPTILELMSPETLTFILATYPDAFDADLTARLEGVAAGTVTVFVPEASVTRTDGNPAVLVQVFKGGDENTVATAHEIFEVMTAFEEAHPGMKTAMVFEQATFIEESIAGVTREGSLGAIFAILVILVFLSGRIGGRYKLSWRATLVTAVSIPLSIFTALLLMEWIPITVGQSLQDVANSSGNSALIFIARLFPDSVTLNIMTLSGLTVAIGRVVDDAIVVLENSYRHIQRGEETNVAIRAATREVAIAIFSATVTTMVVFLPLGFVGGIIGSVFMPFGVTVAWALAASFIVSITVVPALTSLFINKENIPEERETAMQRWYTPMLQWALTHRGLTLLGSTVVFFGSLYLLAQLPQSFIPALGEPTINVGIELPGGTSMLETNAAVTQFEEELSDIAGLGTIQTEVGGAGGFEAMFAGGSVSQNMANVTISVENQDELDALTKAVRAKAVAQFGEENATVSAASQTGFGGFALTLTGDSLEELLPVVEDVKAAIESVDLEGDGVPDIANVTSSVDDLLAGNGSGSTVYIRIDGRPAISFGGELETQNTLGVTNAAKAAIQELDNLPAGAEVSEGFESQQQVEGFESMLLAIGISIVLVYVVMALTFRSLILPFVILFSLPFALVGAAIALFVTGSVLGISALIGFMMLVGIVVTNGIVLMELVQQLRHRGMSTYDALVEGGRTRLRPIWMTALTAILALIPLAASAEAGAIIASDLARAVMGGLLVSTALTLIVVPVVFYLFGDITDWIGKKLGRAG